jgi:hypothetical protein
MEDFNLDSKQKKYIWILKEKKSRQIDRQTDRETDTYLKDIEREELNVIKIHKER